jgi:phenylpyruvate tautomerase PptA (4-oxalocrotonate tautomerase family)
VPADDLFQVVTEHAVKSGLICTDRYLGIDHTADMVLIQITVSEGRNVDQKKALYRAIVDNLAAAPGVRREDVIINLIETKKENWSFGMGLAQYT